MFGEWTPHAIGFGFVIVLLGVVHFFPHSEWTRALLTTYGVGGSGTDGQLRRRDHFRGALMALVLFLLLGAFSIAGLILADRFPAVSRTNWTFAAYGFGFFLLSGVSFLCALGALWRGVRWRATVPTDDSSAPVA